MPEAWFVEPGESYNICARLHHAVASLCPRSSVLHDSPSSELMRKLRTEHAGSYRMDVLNKGEQCDACVKWWSTVCGNLITGMFTIWPDELWEIIEDTIFWQQRRQDSLNSTRQTPSALQGARTWATGQH